MLERIVWFRLDLRRKVVRPDDEDTSKQWYVSNRDVVELRRTTDRATCVGKFIVA